VSELEDAITAAVAAALSAEREAMRVMIREELARVPADTEDRLVDAAEAARLTGLSLSAFRKRSYRGQVPGAVHVGRSLRFSRRALLAWGPQR
jgi:predicted DNA-binding transcriptional regulator AlpA